MQRFLKDYELAEHIRVDKVALTHGGAFCVKLPGGQDDWGKPGRLMKVVYAKNVP